MSTQTKTLSPEETRENRLAVWLSEQRTKARRDFLDPEVRERMEQALGGPLA